LARADELKALINLVDDPDEKIYEQIRSKLISFGEEAIPALEEYWEHNQYGMTFQNRIEEIIHQIQFENVIKNLKHWADNQGKELLRGVILVAKYQYPELDEVKIKKKLHQLKQDVWLELNDSLTAFEQIRVINHILFDIYGFSANKDNFHSPHNSYINHVLDTGKGNPLSLSVIYILVCQSLDIPVYGVNLPNHFVVCYVDRFHTMLQMPAEVQNKYNILFYINPFSRGSIFNANEIDEFLKELKIKPDDEYYKPCDNIQIIRRMIANLIYAYAKNGNKEKINELKKLYAALGEDYPEAAIE
jgi:regulator of sirC expression with transglutaminase-like and TPR domain